jgi:hypothetical protein
MENTVMLCGKCITTNQLGNIIFGVVASELGISPFAAYFGINGPANWPENPEKAVAFMIGKELADLRRTKGKCDICDVITHKYGGPPIDKNAQGLPPCKDSQGKPVVYDGPHTSRDKVPDVNPDGTAKPQGAVPTCSK